MIRVVKIVGESIDLDTGKETSKGLVLTNGIRNAVIPVDDSAVRTVVELFTEYQAPDLGVQEIPVDIPKKARMSRPTVQESDDFDAGEFYSAEDGASSI